MLLEIIHADLKPANFVLVGGTIKLIDFGIAARMHGTEKVVYRRSLQGTLNYISPEAVEYRSDEGCYEVRLLFVRRRDFVCIQKACLLDFVKERCLVPRLYSLCARLRRTAIQ